MPSPPLLPFEELLQPIPGDNPAGEGVPFSVRQQMEEHRKEIDPKNFAEDDPLRPEQAKHADWPAIIGLAQKVLVETSKDLLVGARLTEALTRQHGFAGLRDGLHLLRLLLDECWDRLNPSIEDGDLEVRAGPFNWLDDADHGARFPTTVRTTPLVANNGQAFGWLQWKQSQDGKGQVTKEEFEQAILATPREACQQTSEDLNAALAELDELIGVLGNRLEGLAPGLLSLRQALSDCDGLLQEILKRKGPAPGVAVPEGPALEVAAAQAPVATVNGPPAAARPRTRADVYRQLTEAAALLQQIEPHSPIPYLIQKAVALGALSFPQLMRALIRDENILSELNRELGIQEGAAE
jgi:type VI secretion system protein ImpA